MKPETMARRIRGLENEVTSLRIGYTELVRRFTNYVIFDIKEDSVPPQK